MCLITCDKKHHIFIDLKLTKMRLKEKREKHKAQHKPDSSTQANANASCIQKLKELSTFKETDPGHCEIGNAAVK